jgi:hypothetical protein
LTNFYHHREERVILQHQTPAHARLFFTGFGPVSPDLERDYLNEKPQEVA